MNNPSQSTSVKRSRDTETSIFLPPSSSAALINGSPLARLPPCRLLRRLLSPRPPLPVAPAPALALPAPAASPARRSARLTAQAAAAEDDDDDNDENVSLAGVGTHASNPLQNRRRFVSRSSWPVVRKNPYENYLSMFDELTYTRAGVEPFLTELLAPVPPPPPSSLPSSLPPPQKQKQKQKQQEQQQHRTLVSFQMSLVPAAAAALPAGPPPPPMPPGFAGVVVGAGENGDSWVTLPTGSASNHALMASLCISLFSVIRFRLCDQNGRELNVPRRLKS
ncbi:hypothetical protein F4679DRAFT_587408 [Xylaria curta]|nr:hypothetical protein F4679DRAFT_587408 [Xylaria curta]